MKKITVNHAVLKDALKRIKQAVPSKAALPSLENILFKVNNPTLTLLATDLDITIQVVIENYVELDTEEIYDFLVPFDFLSKIVNLSASDITFDIKEGAQTTVYIRTANDEYSCGTMDDIKEYPKIPSVPSKKFIELNGTFIETLNNAIACVSKDETRPAMTNVCLDVSKAGITVVSTDSHLLFSKRISDGVTYDEKILVSPKTAKALDGFAHARVSWNKEVTAYECSNVTVITRNHDHQYPEWRSVIPSGSSTCLEVEKKLLESALEKCNLNNTELKQTVFTMHPETLRLESTSFEDGKYIKTELPAIHEGELENICFNSKKLLTLIGSIQSANLDKNPTLKFYMSTHTRGTIITAVEDETFQLLIMPIKSN